jgi:hypothetical protein
MDVKQVTIKERKAESNTYRQYLLCLEKHVRGNAPWSHTCPLCRKEWFPAPNRGRADVLTNLKSALNVLAGLEVRNEQVRAEIEHVERALRRIRNVLDGNRWI